MLKILVSEDYGVAENLINTMKGKKVVLDSLNKNIAKFQNKSLIESDIVYIVKNDEDASKLSYETIERVSKDKTLVLYYNKLDKRSKLYKSATKANTITTIELTKNQLIAGIVKKLNISNSLAEYIIAMAGEQYSVLKLELDKLVAINKPITKELIDEVLTIKFENKLFEMIKLLMQKNYTAAYKEIEKLAQLQESNFKILILTTREVFKILKIQGLLRYNDNKIEEITKVPAWQIKYSRPLCNIYTEEQLKDIITKLGALECGIKTGKIEEKNCVDLMYIEMARIGGY